MDKESLRSIYYAKVEELRKRRIPEVEEGCREEALIELVQQNTKYLPLWVVLARDPHTSVGIPKSLYHISSFGSDNHIFFQDKHFYFGGVSIVPKEGFPVCVVSRVKTSKEIGRDAIIQCLEYTLSKIQLNPKPVVPKGYFLFRFTAQWASGGHQDDSVEKMFACSANALEDAIKIFLRHLVSLQENVFTKFFVCFDDIGWKTLKPKNNFWGDRILRQELYTPNGEKITMELMEIKAGKEDQDESEDKR